MMNFALAMSFAERTAYSGKMLLIGIGTVFAALAILMAVLMVFRRIVEGKREKVEKKAPTDPTPAPAKDDLMAVITAAVAAAEADNGAIVAAITAAVAATLAEENGGIVPAFRVVSFRPVKTVSNKK